MYLFCVSASKRAVLLTRIGHEDSLFFLFKAATEITLLGQRVKLEKPDPGKDSSLQTVPGSELYRFAPRIVFHLRNESVTSLNIANQNEEVAQ